MKKVLITGILIAAHLVSFSQMYFGFKGGLNFSQFKADELETSEYRLTTFDGRKTGYHIGLFFRAELFGMYVQPEMIYTVLRGETEIFDIGKQAAIDAAQIQISRLDIPALAGIKLKPVRLYAGPVASFSMTNRTQLEELINYIPEIRKMGIGYQLGTGIDLASFIIDLRYEGNFTKLGDSMDLGGETVPFDRRTNQFIISLGLSF